MTSPIRAEDPIDCPSFQIEDWRKEKERIKGIVGLSRYVQTFSDYLHK
ncbi:MAG: hypothetical protein R6U96_00665 [Promethearchaeia archaeon]